MKKLNDFEDYVSADQKLSDLKAQLHGVEIECDAVLSEINATTKPTDPIQENAQALVDGVKITTVSLNMSKKYQELCQQIKIHQAAVRIQEHTIEKLRLKYSKVICESVEKEYLSLLKTAIESAVKLSKDFTAARNFINDLHNQNVMIIGLPDLPIHLHNFGTWNDPNSNIHRLLDDAQKSGLVNGEYKDRPKIESEPGIPDDGIVRTVSSPDGVREVLVLPGGKLKTLKWLHKTEKEQKQKTATPGTEW